MLKSFNKALVFDKHHILLLKIYKYLEIIVDLVKSSIPYNKKSIETSLLVIIIRFTLQHGKPSFVNNLLHSLNVYAIIRYLKPICISRSSLYFCPPERELVPSFRLVTRI